MRMPPLALTEGLSRAKDRERRFEVAKAVLQGLAAGIHWQSGMIINEQEMASDAVALADALLAELSK